MISHNDTYIEVSVNELSADDPLKEVLERVAANLIVTLKNPGAEGLGVCREAFLDTAVGAYCVRESGSGVTLGLFKRVDNQLTQITLPLPGEVKLMKGDGATQLSPPSGWRIVADEMIQRKYNLGTSPNWILAAIEYVGI